MPRIGPPSTRLASAASWVPMVASWLGPRVLANQVPVLGGRVTWTLSQQVQGGLTLTVPSTSVEDGRTRSWSPRDPGDPLARYGQALDVSILSDGVLTRLGRFQIQEWEEADGVIELKGAGKLQRVLDDRLLSATAPRDGGTLKSEVLRLLPDGISAAFHPSLVDRECPKSMQWDESRIDALYEIADAWPARLRENEWGNLDLLPVLPDVPTPLLSFTDGEGGTLISAPHTDSREDVPNVWVVRSSQDGVEAQAVVEIQAGPMSTGGEYGRVPTFWSSPLLDNEEQCRAAATTRRQNAARQMRTRKVTAAPDPRVMLDDPVELIIGKGTRDQVTEWGVIIGIDMPLTVHDGPMQVDVGVI